MSKRVKIMEQHINKSALRFYGFIFFLCFGVCWILAGEYSLWCLCGGEWKFFQVCDFCEITVSPLIVQMDAETIDSRVNPFLSPLSHTAGVGWHLLGTDAVGRDVFAGLLYGGQRSLTIGLLSGITAVALGWVVGLWSVFSEFIRWPRIAYWIFGVIGFVLLFYWRFFLLLLVFAAMLGVYMVLQRKRISKNRRTGAQWWWGRGIEWYYALPDLLILMVLSVSIGIHQISTLILIIIAVVWPSVAMIARRMGSEITGMPYFHQARRNQISKKDLLVHYLWSNTRSYMWAVLPLVVGRVILLESTLSFLGLGLPPDIVTIGSMISGARDHIEAWWLVVFGSVFIFLLVYPLQLIYKKRI